MNNIQMVDLVSQHQKIRTEIDAAIGNIIDKAWFIKGGPVRGHAPAVKPQRCQRRGIGGAVADDPDRRVRTRMRGCRAEQRITRFLGHLIERPHAHARRRELVRFRIRGGDDLAVGIQNEGRAELAGPQRAEEARQAVCLDDHRQHALPPAVVATRFPFGLFVKRCDIPVGQDVLVYPRVRSLSRHELGLEEIGLGEATGKLSRSGEFYGLEEYREGADLRRVNWPATARRGKLVLCEFEGEGARTHMLDLEMGQAGEPAFERAVEDAASVAVASLRKEGMSVGLALSGEVAIEPGRGAQHERRILDFLAVVGLPEDGPHVEVA